MKRLFYISVMCAMCATSASAFELGGEYFLVKDKTIAAMEFAGRVSPKMDLSLDLGLVFSDTDETDQGAAGSFLGSLVGFHLFYRQLVHKGVTARFGGGVDFWPLYGIHSEESHGGLVFLAELRGHLTPLMDGFLRGRIYVVRGEGLQPGVDRAGNESAPIVWSTGLTWRFP